MRDFARFDRCQFDNRKAQPVGQALADANGEMHSASRLSFDDYDKAHCFSHSFYAGRSKTPPCWALDLNKLGLLLARYMEVRSGHQPRVDSPENRVAFAQRRTLSQIPARVATLDKLTAEFISAKTAGTDPARVLVLARQIRSLDGKLVIDQRGPTLICGIVHYFFRCGYSSVETAAALNHLVSPQAVRQIAHRLKQLWQRMQDGTDNRAHRARKKAEQAAVRCG
jgi:hypothetical protein